MEPLNEFLNTELVTLGKTTITPMTLVVVILVLIASVILARLARGAIGRLGHKFGDDRQGLVYIIQRLGYYVVLIIGVFTGLSLVGIDISTFSVFAGALGVGIGLGLQGMVKEFVSGMALMLDRSLRVGDFVELENGLAGEVVDIGTRATRIVTNDNIDILVPNSTFIEGQLTNWTHDGATRRIHIPFGVAYGSDKELVRKAALEAAANVPFTQPDEGNRKSQVWLTGFGDSALEFELVVWPSLDAAKRPSAMQAAYNWAIEDALRKYEIEIPFPQRDLHLRSFFETKEGEAIKTLGLKKPRATKASKTSKGSKSNDAAEAVMAPEETVRETADTPQGPEAGGGQGAHKK